MLILHIESSSELCSVALAESGNEVGFMINSEPYSHGADINEMIDKLLRDAGKSMSQLDAVSVNRGPGSFTSLRIGMATAKGICFGRDIPLITPDGMHILIHRAMELCPDYDFYVPMIDARRMEVYTVTPVSGTEEEPDFRSEILEEGSYSTLADKKVCFIGNGVEKWQTLTAGSPEWKFISCEINARMMIPVSAKIFAENNFSDLFQAAPVYVKKPNITKSKKRYF